MHPFGRAKLPASTFSTPRRNDEKGLISEAFGVFHWSASYPQSVAPGDDLTCTFINTRNSIADLSITKTNTPGAGAGDQATDTLTRGTTYMIVVTNNGPDAVTGTVLADPLIGRSGVTCTAPPTCSGSACPVGLALAQLEAGVAIGNLENGASVTVTVTCVIN
ncbi:hypothetical protein [Lysobacter sp. Hz 25]|uniref:hypothetical protein n=1 Tax=Lysobacter sp. Hz 25 TaxID=3383698 RepID=UPI0038D5142C